MRIQPPLAGTYGWKFFLYYGAGDADRVMLPYESLCSTKEEVLEEFAGWLNAPVTDLTPDSVVFHGMILRRSAILQVEVDKG